MPEIKPFGPRMVESPSPRAADFERPKDYLTAAEVERLLAATKHSRYHIRDRAILLVMYRHGLRVSELCGLRRADLDLDTARLTVRRLKGSISTVQPVEGTELRAIKRYLATRSDGLPMAVPERSGTADEPVHDLNYLVRTAAEHAGLENVHPHTLRHSCGYHLVNKGCDFRIIQEWLGHARPENTARYTRISVARFEGLWS